MISPTSLKEQVDILTLSVCFQLYILMRTGLALLWEKVLEKTVLLQATDVDW